MKKLGLMGKNMATPFQEIILQINQKMKELANDLFYENYDIETIEKLPILENISDLIG